MLVDDQGEETKFSVRMVTINTQSYMGKRLMPEKMSKKYLSKDTFLSNMVESHDFIGVSLPPSPSSRLIDAIERIENGCNWSVPILTSSHNCSIDPVLLATDSDIEE